MDNEILEKKLRENLKEEYTMKITTHDLQDIFTIMPNIGSASGSEPSLDWIIYSYYRQHFSEEQSENLTVSYTTELVKRFVDDLVYEQNRPVCVNAHDRCDGGPCPLCEPRA